MRLPACLAAVALVVPLALVGLAPPAVAADDVARAASDGDGGRSAASSTAISLSSGVTVFGLPVSARVRVPGPNPTGVVRVLVDGAPVASGRPAANGTVRVPLPATVEVGRHAVTADYVGGSSSDVPVLASSGTARALTVTRTLPGVRTDGTDWSVGRADRKAVHVQVTGVAGVEPSGKVVVRVNGVIKGTATLDPAGEAVVPLARATTSALVVITYGGDRTFLPWVAPLHLLVVR